MPHISDLIKAKQEEGKPFIAFEYFPPRTDSGVQNLYQRFERMAALSASVRATSMGSNHRAGGEAALFISGVVRF